METTHAKNEVSRKAKKAKAAIEAEASEGMERIESGMEERIEQARELVEDLRDRAEMAFHERPYLLPVATGALGLGVGILIGSKLSRVILVTAAGALLSESVRGHVARLSRDFIRDLGKNEGSDDVEEIEESGLDRAT